MLRCLASQSLVSPIFNLQVARHMSCVRANSVRRAFVSRRCAYSMAGAGDITGASGGLAIDEVSLYDRLGSVS